MPYINQSDRDVDGVTTQDVGHLTYNLYSMCLDALPDDPRYIDYHAVIGALEATKLEFYRRHVAPYEDKKIEQNGDVL
jgi:hypothetical protein